MSFAASACPTFPAGSAPSRGRIRRSATTAYSAAVERFNRAADSAFQQSITMEKSIIVPLGQVAK
jgi:hypothetical protein